MQRGISLQLEPQQPLETFSPLSAEKGGALRGPSQQKGVVRGPNLSSCVLLQVKSDALGTVTEHNQLRLPCKAETLQVLSSVGHQHCHVPRCAAPLTLVCPLLHLLGSPESSSGLRGPKRTCPHFVQASCLFFKKFRCKICACVRAVSHSGCSSEPCSRELPLLWWPDQFNLDQLKAISLIAPFLPAQPAHRAPSARCWSHRPPWRSHVVVLARY